MKHFLFCCIGIFLICSCEKDVVLSEKNYLDVKLLLKGDYVDISTSPLSKDMSLINCYYGFEIDSLHVVTWRGVKGELYYDSTYVHYAGGVFDNVDNIGINLEKGHKYRIRCSIIEEREDKLYNENGCVFEPFVAPGYGKYGTQAKVNNSFIYGGEKEVYAYNPAPYMRTIDDDKKFVARVNRYYGEMITDVIDDNSPVLLDMERRNFGLHFLLTPPKEGVLRVCNTYGNPKYEYILDSSTSSIDEEYIYALDLHNDFEISEPQIIWTRAGGEIVDLSPGTTKFYNKTMTTIKVDVNDRVGNSDININIDSEMTQDEIVIK